MASSVIMLFCRITLIFLLFSAFPLSSALLLSSPSSSSPPKAISDLLESTVKGLGFQGEEFKISSFDIRDTLVGHAVAYEFDLEVDKQVLPFKLLEDVNRWEYVDLPIFKVQDEEGFVANGGENWMMEQNRKVNDNSLPVLAPFQLAGPMEIWIQDAKDMRVSLPHDVDAGVLKKVILADGAVVTVKGARSVSLRHPIDLPLPLNRTQNGFASGLMALAEQLRRAARSEGGPLLSLRIVGPTSLTSPSSTSSSSNNRLKLKRLAPGLVELSSPSKSPPLDVLVPFDIGEAATVLTPKHFSTMWPLTSVNGSNANLLGFEKLLATVLGPKASEEGSFKLLKADVSTQTFVKIGFEVEKKLKDGDVDLHGFPEWRTKPESVRMHFEVLAKVDGEKVIPERVMQVNPVIIEDTVAQNVLLGNVSMSKVPTVHPPSNPFTL